MAKSIKSIERVTDRQGDLPKRVWSGIGPRDYLRPDVAEEVVGRIDLARVNGHHANPVDLEEIESRADAGASRHAAKIRKRDDQLAERGMRRVIGNAIRRVKHIDRAVNRMQIEQFLAKETALQAQQALEDEELRYFRAKWEGYVPVTQRPDPESIDPRDELCDSIMDGKFTKAGRRASKKSR